MTTFAKSCGGGVTAAALALLAAVGCAPDRVSAPSITEGDVAAAFSGKKFQLTNGTVCGASSATKAFDQSLDENITGVDVTGFLPFGAQYSVAAAGGSPADLGHFEFICGGFPNLYTLVSDVTGRAGTSLSAGDLTLGTYTIQVQHAGKVLAKTRFEIVP